MALPVGTEAVDREGDYLRRSALGWTYRHAGQPVQPDDVMPPAALALYMPMVVTTATVSTPPQLDSTALVDAVASYLQGFYPEVVGHHTAARGVVSVIRDHLQKEQGV